jgi:glucose/arabinose dehydrogenase
MTRFKTRLELTIIIISYVFVLILLDYHAVDYASASTGNADYRVATEANLTVDLVASGLKFPTSMAFLGPDDILVLEKNHGTVRRVLNGNLLPEPLLDVNVGTLSDRGMLGIGISNDHKYVFLYFTETSRKDGMDTPKNSNKPDNIKEDGEPLGNRLYRYEWIDDKLVNPKLLLDLPPIAPEGGESGRHNGGKILIGPEDNEVYVVVGDVGDHETKTQNYLNNDQLTATSVILRISQDGQAIKGILGGKDPINKFFAYGIRSSFGMDFDPVTGYLWDTENGDISSDEINLVEPGFNSGWRRIEGMSALDDKFNIKSLEDFDGKGKYSDPKFVWEKSVAPSAIKFLNSDKLGQEFENDMFVGDFNNGNIYHFGLNEERTELSLNGDLDDKVANSHTELKEVIFAEGFGGITDLQVGPDGYLYVLALQEMNKCDLQYSENPAKCFHFDNSIGGAIFRILPYQ